MTNLERYPYLESRNAQGEAMPRPLLPLTLQYDRQSVAVDGLLDTGATVNVLPYEIGLALGCTWSERLRAVALTGNLARYAARVIPLIGIVGQLTPVPLIFAWTQAENVPLILGQVNFFAEFDVCFFGSSLAFEIQPKGSRPSD